MLTSTGAVAFGIVSLLPVELILQVSSNAGFAMVFALLIAAIIWNLGTWWLGLPASSSHTLIGSIIGVGVANALLNGRNGTSRRRLGPGLQHRQGAADLAARRLLRLRAAAAGHEAAGPQAGALRRAQAATRRRRWWIRGLLIFTCTGVSFAHGSNDGQKGMGLIMLILIGTVPTAYALNRAVPDSDVPAFEQTSEAASQDHRGQGRRLRHHGRSAAGRHRLRARQEARRRRLSVARGADARHRRTR